MMVVFDLMEGFCPADGRGFNSLLTGGEGSHTRLTASFLHLLVSSDLRDSHPDDSPSVAGFSCEVMLQLLNRDVMHFVRKLR